MKVTITQLKGIGFDDNGTPLPIGGAYNGEQVLTAAGSVTAMASGTSLVRIATDTAIQGNFYGTGSQLIPANTVEFFPAIAAQTFAIATA